LRVLGIPITMLLVPRTMFRIESIFLSVVCLAACRSEPAPAGPEPIDSPADVYIPPGGLFCDLPGSVQHIPGGLMVVPGGSMAHSVEWLNLPVGFCAHYYGNIANTRQIRFAPGGELFVASPTTGTTGGGFGGHHAIIILPDDDHDGLADTAITFLDNLPSTQGLLFANDHFYYQDSTSIMKVPYVAGARAPSGPSEPVAQITVFSSGGHWPKTLDQADDGTIYVTNGDDQEAPCDPSHPFRGGILKLDGPLGGTQVSKGFRNPIAVGCQHGGKGVCFAVELAKDYSAAEGGREKLVPIRQGDDWGFPCCATKHKAHSGIEPVPDCSTVTAEDVSFVIGDTPFGVDFAPASWPAPYTGSAFVPLHGVVGSWVGARLVAIEIDSETGLPKPGTDIQLSSTGAMTDFATGWDDGRRLHGRPANVAFARDGRLFIGNDNDGNIIWVAPLDLPR